MIKSILINGRFLTQDLTGVQRVAFEYINALEKYYIDIEIKIVAPQKKYFKSKNIDFRSEIIEVGTQSGYFWEQIELPFFLKNQTDILLNFCNLAPYFYHNNIIVLHDVAFLDNPSWFSQNFIRVYKVLIPKLLKKSKKVITVSQFSKKRILKYYSFLDANKVKVIYNGFTTFEGKKSENLEGKYALMVGSINRRKNHKLVIDTFRKLGGNFKLIIVGNKGKSFDYEINDIPDNVIFKSEITNNELFNLYNHSNIVVCSSLYEGFGLPILEALQFNKKVIVSDIEVFRELFNESVIYFDPLSKESLLQIIKENWSTSNTLPIFDLHNFSWKSSTAALVETLKSN